MEIHAALCYGLGIPIVVAFAAYAFAYSWWWVSIMTAGAVVEVCGEQPGTCCRACWLQG